MRAIRLWSSSSPILRARGRCPHWYSSALRTSITSALRRLISCVAWAMLNARARRVSIGQTSSAPEIAAAAIKIRFNGSVKNVTNYLFFCGGKSVQTPSNHSAAMPTDSQSVGCGPRENGLFVRNAFRLALRLCFSSPRNLRISIRDRWNLERVENRFFPCSGRRHMRFMHGFMRKHGLANNIAHRINVRHIRALLMIDFDQTALSHPHARLVSADSGAVWRASNGDEHQIVALQLTGGGNAFKADMDAFVFRLRLHGLRIQHQIGKALTVKALPNIH